MNLNNNNNIPHSVSLSVPLRQNTHCLDPLDVLPSGIMSATCSRVSLTFRKSSTLTLRILGSVVEAMSCSFSFSLYIATWLSNCSVGTLGTLFHYLSGSMSKTDGSSTSRPSSTMDTQMLWELWSLMMTDLRNTCGSKLT